MYPAFSAQETQCPRPPPGSTGPPASRTSSGVGKSLILNLSSFIEKREVPRWHRCAREVVLCVPVGQTCSVKCCVRLPVPRGTHVGPTHRDPSQKPPCKARAGREGRLLQGQSLMPTLQGAPSTCPDGESGGACQEPHTRVPYSMCEQHSGQCDRDWACPESMGSEQRYSCVSAPWGLSKQAAGGEKRQGGACSAGY